MNILLLSKISKVYQQKFGNFGSLILMRLLDLLEQVEGPHPAAHAELGPAPDGGHAVQLRLHSYTSVWMSGRRGRRSKL